MSERWGPCLLCKGAGKRLVCAENSVAREDLPPPEDGLAPNLAPCDSKVRITTVRVEYWAPCVRCDETGQNGGVT